MSFLSGITGASVAPSVGSTQPTISGSFLSSVKLPTSAQTAQASQVALTTGAAQVARANANYAGSLPGLAMNTIKGLPNASGIPQQWQEGQDQIDQPFIQKGQQGGKMTPGQGAEGALSVGSGVVTKLFSPLAPAFKPLGAGINAAGNALANTPYMRAYGKDLANSPPGTNNAPERILQGIGNASNVLGVIAGGAEAFKPKVEGGFLETTTKPGETAPPTEPPPPGGGAPTSIPKPLHQTHSEYAKSQGYEPYTPHDQLPVIQTGPKASSDLPTIQTETPKTPAVKGDLTVHPLTEETEKSPAPLARVTPTETPSRTVAEPASKPLTPYSPEKPTTGGYKPLTPAESHGEIKTSTLASKVDANAVERKLTDGLGQLPEYNKVDMKEQASFASYLINNEPDKAMRIAMGEEPPPAHILPEAVFTALEDKATREGDAGTLSKLATESNMSSQATAMGQRIRALGERDNLSPVKSIQEVSEAREGSPKVKSNSRTLTRQAPTLARSIREAVPTKDDWGKFIDDISCSY